MIDLETGVRGFVITRQERFLEPWSAARAAFPEEAEAARRLVDDPEQAEPGSADRSAPARPTSEDYSVPLVNAARRNEASARSVAATGEGKRRVDALRAEFDRFSRVRARHPRDAPGHAPTRTLGERSSWDGRPRGIGRA